jgi:hypothetical protein
VPPANQPHVPTPAQVYAADSRTSGCHCAAHSFTHGRHSCRNGNSLSCKVYWDTQLSREACGRVVEGGELGGETNLPAACRLNQSTMPTHHCVDCTTIVQVATTSAAEYKAVTVNERLQLVLSRGPGLHTVHRLVLATNGHDSSITSPCPWKALTAHHQLPHHQPPMADCCKRVVPNIASAGAIQGALVRWHRRAWLVACHCVPAVDFSSTRSPSAS